MAKALYHCKGRNRLLLAGFFAIGGCALPDWADPIEIIGGPTPKPERIEVVLPELRGPWPSLASVPASPPRPSPQADRNRRQAALDSDNLSGVASVGPASGLDRPSEVEEPEPAPQVTPTPRPRRPDTQVSAPPDPEPPPPPPRALAPVTLFTAEPSPLAAPPPVAPVAPAGVEPAAPGATPVEPSAGLRRDLLGVIYFAPGSTDLDRAERRLLRDVILLRRQRGGRIRVVGHAAGDADVGSSGPLGLSIDRARAVAAGLRDQGLGPAFMELAAAADTAPVYDASAPTGEAGNRRVEIFLEY